MKRDVINFYLLLFFIGLQLFQLFALPAWLLPHSAYWGYGLLLPILLTNSWWAFIHESLHGCMFPYKHLNRVAGRLNAVLFGSPFDLLRWGHLLHHAYSRTERERAEVYRPNAGTLLWVRLNYYFRLLGGLYLFEVAGGLLLLLPRRWLTCLVNQLSQPENVVELLYHKMSAERLTAARTDAIFILLVYGFSFYLYGAFAWMLFAAILARACLISVVDNVFHYATPLALTRYAHNLYLPGWASRLLLHFNLHGIHHLNPHRPWWQLPTLHAASGKQYQGHWLHAIQLQFNGPIACDALNKPP